MPVMKKTIATLIKAGQPTPNDNVYPREVLIKMVEDANKCIAAGDIIPLSEPIGESGLHAMKGQADKFSMTEDGLLQVDVTVHDELVKDMLASFSQHGISVQLNTMTMVEEGDSEVVDGVRHIKNGKFVALAIETKRGERDDEQS